MTYFNVAVLENNSSHHCWTLNKKEEEYDQTGRRHTTGTGRDAQSDSWHGWDWVCNIKAVRVAEGKVGAFKDAAVHVPFPVISQRGAPLPSAPGGRDTNCRQRLLMSMYNIRPWIFQGRQCRLLKRLLFSLHQFWKPWQVLPDGFAADYTQLFALITQTVALKHQLFECDSLPHSSATPADKADNSIFTPPAAIWIADNTENKHATSLSRHSAGKQTKGLKVVGPEVPRWGAMWTGRRRLLWGQLEAGREMEPLWCDE